MAICLPTRSAALLAFLSIACANASATDYPPANHGGGDLTLHTGDRIWGTHTGIGRFVIPDGEVVVVRPYLPTAVATGGVAIYATNVEILGTLDGNAAGYTGGGGGVYSPPSVGGTGTYSGFGGSVGYYNTSTCWYKYTSPPQYGTTVSSLGGSGHSGDGPAKGEGGRGQYYSSNPCTGYWGGAAGCSATDGGYGTQPGQNNDVSVDDSILLGSGGGGAASNGRGGGNGGGMIRIVPSVGLLLGPESKISVDGAWGALPISPSGGNSWPPIYTLDGTPPGRYDGGAGSGGGICIDLRQMTDEDQLVIGRGAVISSRTPSDAVVNPPIGGTVKIMRGNLMFSDQLFGAYVTCGRYLATGNFASETSRGWDLYE